MHFQLSPPLPPSPCRLHPGGRPCRRRFLDPSVLQHLLDPLLLRRAAALLGVGKAGLETLGGRLADALLGKSFQIVMWYMPVVHMVEGRGKILNVEKVAKRCQVHFAAFQRLLSVANFLLVKTHLIQKYTELLLLYCSENLGSNFHDISGLILSSSFSRSVSKYRG